MARPPHHPYERYSITDYREDSDARGSGAPGSEAPGSEASRSDAPGSDTSRSDEAGSTGTAWDCELLRHGQHIAHVGNDGTGGPDEFAFDDAGHEAEFVTAATRQFPDHARPGDVLVQRLITNRQMSVLDEVAYCFAEDRFDELGEHRLAGPGLTFEQVREALAELPAERGARIWDRKLGDMVRVRAVTAQEG